ncbi:hypothetical protein GBA52_004171 [Prunus armeniaca]|nr:hypothetical protein GBA52_004171 [Prunus armeniaca]
MHSSGTRTGLSSKPHCSPTSQNLTPKSNHSEYSCRVVGLPSSPSTSTMSGLRPSPTLTCLRLPFPICYAAMRANTHGMKWQVMDITTITMQDESFDVVVDKGGLDALMEPEFGPKMGNQYLAEVNRVLKCGGKFICFTWAWSDINASVQVCFSPTFFGWKMDIHPIPLKLTTKRNNLQTFMVVARKDQMATAILHQITTSSSLNTTYGNQACRLQLEALENENRIRREYSFTSTGSGIAAISS